MSKHTPGPAWMKHLFPLKVAKDDGMAVLLCAGGDTIAVICGGDFKTKKPIADLLAASHEMHSALKEAVAALERVYDCADTLPGWVCDMQDAISKAEGRE